MNLEIERKFLVRVGGGQGWIPVKGMQPGRVRDEYEYPISSWPEDLRQAVGRGRDRDGDAR